MVTKQMTGSMSRWGLACVLAGAVASAPQSVLAARPSPVPLSVHRFVPDVDLEVLVAAAIVEAAELRRWVDEEGREVLDGLPDEPVHRGSLRVEIDGALYDYQVTITPLRDGLVVGVPSTWKCECSNEQLLEKLRAALPEVVGVLEVEEAEPPPEPVDLSPVTQVDDDSGRQRGRLGPGGAAGVTLMTVGALGAGAGVALMAVRDVQVFKEPYIRRNGELSPAGGLIAGASVGLVAAGFVLYLLRDRAGNRRRASVATVAPTMIGLGQMSLTVSGRF